MGLWVYRACSDSSVPFFRIIKVYGYTAMFFFFLFQRETTFPDFCLLSLGNKIL